LRFLFNGCLRTYYPTIYHTSSSPIIFYTKTNLEQGSNYLGMDLTAAKGSYDDEEIYLIKCSYLNVKTEDHINVSWEIFGNSGVYRVSGVGKEYDGTKTLFGLGGNIKFNLNFKIDNLKIGLGLSFGGASEFGEYYSFRKSGERNGVIDSNEDLILPMFSLFPVFAYEFSESTVLSSQMNIGLPGIISPSVVLNNDGYVYWLSWIPDNDLKENYFGQRIVFGFLMDLSKFGITF